MHISDLVKVRIKLLLKEKNLPMHRLSTYSGIAPSTLKNIIYSKCSSPGIDTLYKICNGLDMTLAEFFSSPIFNDTFSQSDIINKEL